MRDVDPPAATHYNVRITMPLGFAILPKPNSASRGLLIPISSTRRFTLLRRLGASSRAIPP